LLRPTAGGEFADAEKVAAGVEREKRAGGGREREGASRSFVIKLPVLFYRN
jgi:hypothetical protein